LYGVGGGGISKLPAANRGILVFGGSFQRILILAIQAHLLERAAPASSLSVAPAALAAVAIVAASTRWSGRSVIGGGCGWIRFVVDVVVGRGATWGWRARGRGFRTFVSWRRRRICRLGCVFRSRGSRNRGQSSDIQF
jgi:hypothetical protein